MLDTYFDEDPYNSSDCASFFMMITSSDYKTCHITNLDEMFSVIMNDG